MAFLTIIPLPDVAFIVPAPGFLIAAISLHVPCSALIHLVLVLVQIVDLRVRLSVGVLTISKDILIGIS